MIQFWHPQILWQGVVKVKLIKTKIWFFTSYNLCHCTIKSIQFRFIELHKIHYQWTRHICKGHFLKACLTCPPVHWMIWWHVLNFLLKLTQRTSSDKCSTCFASGLAHVSGSSSVGELSPLHLTEHHMRTPNALIKFTVRVQNHLFYMLLLLNNLWHTQHPCP